MRFSLLISLTLLTSVCFAQSDFQDEIDFYGDVMVSAYDSLHRVKAGDIFYEKFTAYLNTNNSDTDDLKWNKWVSVLSSADSTFRIITWELNRGEADFDYYGFIQFSDNRLVELSGAEERWDKISYEDRQADDWPEALYYNLMKLDDSHYMIFGINRLDKFDNVKVAEILTITNDEVMFGAPYFNDADGSSKYRLVLKYADDAQVALNYNESLNLLIYDHLIPRMGRIEGQGTTMLPDGSYEAYKLEEGKWVYVEKVIDHNYAEAPRPMAKSKKSDKDIFGRNKKNK